MRDGRRLTGRYADPVLELVRATGAALDLRQGRRPVASRPPGSADADDRVRWCVDRYHHRYRALVISDVHPAAAHLAVALDAPWLPLPEAGRPPAGYRRMIEESLRPAAPILMITEERAPSDPSASLARYAAQAGHPPLFFRGSASRLSAAVAQLYRDWLRGAGKTGDRLVVECGPLTDLWHVVRAGLVPYWSPGTAVKYADDVVWWLAGEQRYTSIEVLLRPAGGDGLAPWRAVASFASRRGVVEPAGWHAYGRGPHPGRHATRVLRRHPYDLPLPAPLSLRTAIRELS